MAVAVRCATCCLLTWPRLETTLRVPRSTVPQRRSGWCRARRAVRTRRRAQPLPPRAVTRAGRRGWRVARAGPDRRQVPGRLETPSPGWRRGHRARPPVPVVRCAAVAIAAARYRRTDRAPAVAAGPDAGCGRSSRPGLRPARRTSSARSNSASSSSCAPASLCAPWLL